MRDLCTHPDHRHPDDFAAETCRAWQLDGYHIDQICATCGEMLPCADRCYTQETTLDTQDEEC